jgi:hypothetical protein
MKHHQTLDFSLPGSFVTEYFKASYVIVIVRDIY